MKSLVTAVHLGLFFLSAMSCKQTVSTGTVAPTVENVVQDPVRHMADNQLLHDTILAMDAKYFEAYNTCDLETQENFYSDDIEFYHDKGGLMTDKKALIEALKDNICGKVTRELIPGSMKVYPIQGYGAVAECYHKFFNKEEPDAPQEPSKAITLWKATAGGWKMARIISLH